MNELPNEWMSKLMDAQMNGRSNEWKSKCTPVINVPGAVLILYALLHNFTGAILKYLFSFSSPDVWGGIYKIFIHLIQVHAL